MNMKVQGNGPSEENAASKKADLKKADLMKNLPVSEKGSAEKLRVFSKFFSSITSQNKVTSFTQHTGSLDSPKKEKTSFSKKISSIFPKIFRSEVKTTLFSEEYTRQMGVIKAKNILKASNARSQESREIQEPAITSQTESPLTMDIRAPNPKVTKASSQEPSETNQPAITSQTESPLPKGIEPTAAQKARHQRLEAEKALSKELPVTRLEKKASIDADRKAKIEERNVVLEQKKAVIEERKLQLSAKVEEYRSKVSSMDSTKIQAEQSRLTDLKNARVIAINLVKQDIENLNIGTALRYGVNEAKQRHGVQIAEQQVVIDSYDQMLAILTEENERRKTSS